MVADSSCGRVRMRCLTSSVAPTANIAKNAVMANAASRRCVSQNTTSTVSASSSSAIAPLNIAAIDHSSVFCTCCSSAASSTLASSRRV